MDTVKVFVENWQSSPWHKDWIPIFIAAIALFVSLASLYWTREQFIKSNRPFVWALSYGVIDQANRTITPIPFRIGFRNTHSPARILKLEVQVRLDKDILFANTEKDFVRFPDDRSEWTFTVGKNEHDAIMRRPEADQRRLERIISIDYSSLDGGRVYHFALEQVFQPSDNQWMDRKATAD